MKSQLSLLGSRFRLRPLAEAVNEKARLRGLFVKVTIAGDLGECVQVFGWFQSHDDTLPAADTVLRQCWTGLFGVRERFTVVRCYTCR